MARSGQAHTSSVCTARGRGAGGEAELGHDVDRVPVDRVLAQTNRRAMSGLLNPCDELEHVELAGRQHRYGARRQAAGSAAVADANPGRGRGRPVRADLVAVAVSGASRSAGRYRVRATSGSR
jgi:hypothetical protein